MADITMTTSVPSLRSSFVGQLTDFISERTSRKKRLTSANFIISPNTCLGLRRRSECGRTGRNRTRNTRFWRPVLYQLNYCPATYITTACLALFVVCVFAAGGAEFLQLHSGRVLAFVASSRIITILAIFASQYYNISHLSITGDYSMTLDTTPLPMVCPPSRIAKRKPCSIAIGVISVAVISTLSPGITILTPSGSSKEPVTSVVRK